MKRRAAFVLVATVVGAFVGLIVASARDLREQWTWAPPSPDMGDDDMAGVQVDTRPYTVSAPIGGT